MEEFRFAMWNERKFAFKITKGSGCFILEFVGGWAPSCEAPTMESIDQRASHCLHEFLEREIGKRFK
jgi:hypothetical protein